MRGGQGRQRLPGGPEGDRAGPPGGGCRDQRGGRACQQCARGAHGLREAPEKAFYCLFDAESGEEAPQFFPSLEALEEAFAQRYCTSLTPWEDMSDEEMDEWIDRLSDDLEELAAEDTADE